MGSLDAHIRAEEVRVVFQMILPETGVVAAAAQAERLRKDVEALRRAVQPRGQRPGIPGIVRLV
jgi:hypothetical protein